MSALLSTIFQIIKYSCMSWWALTSLRRQSVRHEFIVLHVFIYLSKSGNFKAIVELCAVQPSILIITNFIDSLPSLAPPYTHKHTHSHIHTVCTTVMSSCPKASSLWTTKQTFFSLFLLPYKLRKARFPFPLYFFCHPPSFYSPHTYSHNHQHCHPTRLN